DLGAQLLTLLRGNSTEAFGQAGFILVGNGGEGKRLGIKKGSRTQQTEGQQQAAKGRDPFSNQYHGITPRGLFNVGNDAAIAAAGIQRRPATGCARCAATAGNRTWDHNIPPASGGCRGGSFPQCRC